MDKESLFHTARLVLNLPKIRVAVSKTIGASRNVHHGGTFWLGSVVPEFKKYTGSKAKLRRFISTQVKDSKSKRMVLIDLGSHSVTCAHYVTLLLDKVHGYAIVFDSGVGERRNTYADAKKRLYPIIRQWLKKNAATIFPSTHDKTLYEMVGGLPMQRNNRDALCQTYTLMFRASITGTTTYEQILAWQSKTNKNPGKAVAKIFKSIFKKSKQAKTELILVTGDKKAAGKIAKFTHKFMTQ